MNPSPNSYLGRRHDEVAGDTRRPGSVATGEVQPFSDRGEIVTELWQNYSQEVTSRFARLFTPALLEGCGLPREVVENHLLVEIYRAMAFPALLAESLATHAAATSSGALAELPPVAGSPRRLAAVIRSRRQRGPVLEGLANLAFRFRAVTGLATGVASVVVGVLRLEISRWKAGTPGGPLPAGNLFVIFPRQGAHTRDIWDEIQRIPEAGPPPVVLVLDHKPLDRRMIRQVESRGGRVIHLMRPRDLRQSLAALRRSCGPLLRLHRLAERDLGICLGPVFHGRTGAWFLRGLMHARFIENVGIADPGRSVAIFGLIAHADSRLADHALRQAGAKTIHWLHGVVEDALHYRANSTVCLCLNEVDAALRRRHGSYGSCHVHAGKQPENAISPGEPERPASALVITNLIHPDNRFAAFGAPRALEELLRMTAECFRTMEIAHFTWRPHPRESKAAGYGKFLQLALDLGFRIDNSTALGSQVGRHRHVVTTFSGSIGEAAAAAAVPAIYAGLPYETEGHWGRLPEGLKFGCATGLRQVLQQVAEKPWADEQRTVLLAQYNRTPGGTSAARSLLETLPTSAESLFRQQPGNSSKS